MLAYLEVKKDNQTEEDVLEEVEIPELRDKTIKEAKSILKDLGLELTLKEETEEDIKEKVIIEQLPKPRSKSYKRKQSGGANLKK